VETLPEIVVTDLRHQTGEAGVDGVAAVHFQAAVQRQFVLDLQLRLQSAGRASGAQHGGHVPVGALLAQAGQLLLHRGHVRHAALGQARGLLADAPQGKITGPGHFQASYPAFRHLELDHPTLHVLLRNVHEYRRVAGVVVSLFQGLAGLFHVVHTPPRPQKTVDGLFDHPPLQHAVAVHLVFPDVETRLRLGRRGRRRIGERHANREAKCEND
jgi:hypothetical protein